MENIRKRDWATKGTGCVAVMMIMAMLIGTAGAQIAEVKEKQETKYTTRTETTCKDGRCSMSSSANIRFVEEDGRWKDIEDARRLDDKGLFEVQIKSDGVHGIEIGEFNNSCIEIRTYSEDIFKFEYNTDIPIKIGDRTVATSKIPGILSPTSSFMLCDDSIMKEQIHFGSESTTVDIITTDGNTGYLRNTDCGSVGTTTTLNDNYQWTGHYTTGSGQEFRGYLDYDTSEIPSGSNILASWWQYWVGSETIETGDEFFHLYTCDYGTLANADWTVSLGTDHGLIFDTTMSTSTWYEINVSTDDIVTEGATQFCIRITKTCTDVDDRVIFGSGGTNYEILWVEWEEGAPAECYCTPGDPENHIFYCDPGADANIYQLLEDCA